MANVSVSNTTGLYAINSATSILNSAQSLDALLANSATVGFYLTNSNTQVSADAIGSAAGNYGNANVASYLPTYTGSLGQSSDIIQLYADVTAANTAIVTVQTNLTKFETYANATFGGSSYGNANVSAYLPTYTGSLANSSSIVTLTSEVNALQSNTGGLQTEINSINANVTAANTAIVTVQNNLTSFETYANLTYGTSNYGNANVAAYLPTYTGNLQAGNVVVQGNLTVQGTTTTINHNEYVAGQLVANATTPSTSTTTGAIVSDGGLGVAGNINAGSVYTNNYLFANGVSIFTAITSNAATLQTEINTINANLGAFETYANATFVTSSGSYGNANVATYLPTYTGNIGGNLTTASQPYLTSVGSTAAGLELFGGAASVFINGYGTTLGIQTNQITTQTDLNIHQGNITVVGDASGKGYLIVNNTAIANSVVSTNGYFWANGTAYSTSSGSSYGNTQVAALLSIENIPVAATSFVSNGFISTSSTGITIFGAPTPTGAIAAPYGSLGIGGNAYIVGTANIGNIQSAGSITTTTGYFWANGSPYTPGVTQIVAGTNITISPSGGTGAVTINATGGGSSFSGNLAGNVLYDGVNERIFANAYPLSTPNTSVVGNYFSNYIVPTPVYSFGVLQAPVAPTGQVNNSGLSIGLVATGNIGLQSSYQTTNNRTTTGHMMYLGLTPVTANSMTSSDRVRGVTNLLEINMQGKTWNGSSTSSQVQAVGGFLSQTGSGTITHGVAQGGSITVTPSGGTANLQYGSCFYGTVSFSSSNGTQYQGNVQYARLLAGSLSSLTGNLTVQQAIGLHTVSGWAGTVGTSSGAAQAYIIRNEDTSTNIYHAGNITLATSGKGIIFGDGTFQSTAVGSYGNTQVAAYLPTYSGNIGGTLTTSAQPNITSVGTLTGLTLSGNINVQDIIFSDSTVQTTAYTGSTAYTGGTTEFLTAGTQTVTIAPSQPYTLLDGAGADWSSYTLTINLTNGSGGQPTNALFNIGFRNFYKLPTIVWESGGSTNSYSTIGSMPTDGSTFSTTMTTASGGSLVEWTITSNAIGNPIQTIANLGVGTSFTISSSTNDGTPTTGGTYRVYLNGNASWSGNPSAGQTFNITVYQDSTGGRTMSWPSWKWAGGSAGTLSTAANAIDFVTVFYDGNNYLASLVKGYA